MLKASAAADKNVSLAQPWAQAIPFLPIDDGSVSGRVIDLQGLFNLNSLTLPSKDPNKPSDAQLQFQRLLDNLPGTDR